MQLLWYGKCMYSIARPTFGGLFLILKQVHLRMWYASTNRRIFIIRCLMNYARRQLFWKPSYRKTPIPMHTDWAIWSGTGKLKNGCVSVTPCVCVLPVAFQILNLKRPKRKQKMQWKELCWKQTPMMACTKRIALQVLPVTDMGCAKWCNTCTILWVPAWKVIWKDITTPVWLNFGIRYKTAVIFLLSTKAILVDIMAQPVVPLLRWELQVFYVPIHCTAPGLPTAINEKRLSML